MQTSVYDGLVRQAANENPRPRRPNVIALAIEAVGKNHYRHNWQGHWIWRIGRWDGPFKLGAFIREANVVLKANGEPQITGNPNWAAP